MKKPKRLLVPAALAVSACTPPPPEPPCGSSPYDICMPDGGYYCSQGCGVARLPDGGVMLDGQGHPICFC